MALVRKKVIVAKLDGTIAEYPILPVTEMAFERNFKQGITQAFNGSDQNATKLYWIAWEAEHHAGNVVLPFDEWAGTVEAVDVEVEPIPLESSARPI